MTEKQEKILRSALKLFAQHGYAATSTAKVAKEAGVSEGLIFRHFGNKEGLLAALLAEGAERTAKLVNEIAKLPEPQARIKAVCHMPWGIESSEYDYWRLLYALKWQSDRYDAASTAPIKAMLAEAFTELGAESPTAEAELILVLLDGLVSAFLLRRPSELNQLKTLIEQRYT